MKFKDDESLNQTQENVKGIVSRLQKGTKPFNGEEAPLTPGQIRRRLLKLEEQNEVLEKWGLPGIRVKQSGQVNKSEVE